MYEFIIIIIIIIIIINNNKISNKTHLYAMLITNLLFSYSKV